MDITIIGAGNMARGIATRALAGGHSVKFLTPEPEGARELASELGANTAAGVVGDRLETDIVVLAVWYDAVQSVLDVYREQLAGKVVVDITNPIDTDTFQPLKLEAGSAAKMIAMAVPDARVVKAFNTTFASTLVDGNVAGRTLDVLIAADDDQAKQAVSKLATDGGLNAVDAGPLERAHELEAMGYMHMALQETLGTEYGSSLKLLA
ncbi:MAG: oxidoreductase coenzyme F420-dependent [Thermoleophilia bacterium]|jgi:NADPH-dependent F420 reductase|nr:oxidoreductase coenzyme F420-dependent [Thermoleophilia bacterium]